jgi:hypothetical protein
MKVPPNTHEYCSRTNPQKISCQNDTRLYDKGTPSKARKPSGSKLIPAGLNPKFVSRTNAPQTIRGHVRRLVNKCDVWRAKDMEQDKEGSTDN